MPAPRAISMLPCSDIDEIAEFFGALGFHVTHVRSGRTPTWHSPAVEDFTRDAPH